MKKRFGDERRTEIQSVTGEVDIEDLIAEEQCVYTLTEAGILKTSAQGHLSGTAPRRTRHLRHDPQGRGHRAGDVRRLHHDYVLFVTDRGRLFRIKGYTIAEGSRTSKGSNIVNLLQLAEGEKVTNMICQSKDAEQSGAM